MAKKSKNTKKSKAKKKLKKKASSAVKGKAARVAHLKGKPSRSVKRRPGRAAVEPSSGSEGSSLDPRRIERLRIEGKSEPPLKGRMAGDVSGLSGEELDDSESVEELVEEGQDYEGELVQGVENAPAADQGEVRTHAPAEPNDEAPSYKNRNRL